jgi:hypothetical protein
MYAMAPRTSHRIMLRCWNTCWNDCVSHRKSRSLERSRCSDAAMQTDQCRTVAGTRFQHCVPGEPRGSSHVDVLVAARAAKIVSKKRLKCFHSALVTGNASLSLYLR